MWVKQIQQETQRKADFAPLPWFFIGPHIKSKADVHSLWPNHISCRSSCSLQPPQLFLKRDKPKPAISKHADSSNSINVKLYRQQVSQHLFVKPGNPVLVLTQGYSYHASLGEVLLWWNMTEALPHDETNPPVCQTTGGFLGRHIIICSVEVFLVVKCWCCRERKKSLWISSANEQNINPPLWFRVNWGSSEVLRIIFTMCSCNGQTFATWRWATRN